MSLGARSGEQGRCSSTVICLLAKISLTGSALIQAPTFSRRHTKTHSDIKRRHSERDCHRSTTTQLWNADMPTSSTHTEVSVHCCHDKHTVASSRTLLSDLVWRVTAFWIITNGELGLPPASADFLLGWIYNPEDRDYIFLRRISFYAM
jgi:hypothetical protein